MMTVKDLIDELSSYNEDCIVSFCTSPTNTLSILSIYEVVEDGRVWFDLAEDE